MEVLHYEVVSNSMSAITLFIFIVLILLVSYYFRKSEKWLSVVISAVLIPTFLITYFTSQDEQYEYQKVKVSDWNIVHNEGWEVVNQEGEIVELKRKLEEE